MTFEKKLHQTRYKKKLIVNAIGVKNFSEKLSVKYHVTCVLFIFQ